MVGLVDACTDNVEYLGQSARGLGAWLTSGMFPNGFTAVNPPTMTGGSTSGTVTRMAGNIDLGYLWMTRDANAWPGGGDPVAGTNPSYIFDKNSRLYLAYAGNSASAVATLPTSGADFVYAVPSGYPAW